MPYNPQRIEQLREVYTRNLKKAREKYPERYNWRPSMTADTVAAATISAVSNMSIRHVMLEHAHGWEYTAKELGIKNTYKAWEEWLNSEPS